MSSPGGTDTDRIGKLRRAEKLLNEAADLMDDALRMSGMEQRSGNDSETIRRIASSAEYGGSLHNIIADLEYGSTEQPIWTQPLRSPKHQFDLSGKDERRPYLRIASSADRFTHRPLRFRCHPL